MNKEITEIPKEPLKFLFFISKPHKVPAILAMIAVFVASVMSAFVPYIFKRVIDTINGTEGLWSESVWFWAMLYVVFGFATAMLWRASGFAGMRWSTGVRATSRERLTEYVTKQSYGYFTNRFAGAISSKLINASNGVKDMAEDILWQWSGFLIGLTVSLSLVLFTNIYIGFIFLAWILIVTPLNIALVKRKIPLGVAAQARETELRAQTVDVLTNINAMHDYARRNFEMARFRELIDIRRKAGLKNWTFSEVVLVINTVLEAIFVGGMIFSTVYLWDSGRITAGDIILVLALIISVRSGLANIGQRFNGLAETVSELKEGLAEILVAHDVTDIQEAKDLAVSLGEIMFTNISFKYETQEIFTGLNLHIKPGERVGFVGRSGAGKTTLVKLITRQYDLTGGEILIDGQNIAKVKQESLRESIAVVPQDPLLFHRSLKENIRYGKLSATDGEIIEAAEHAQAHQFIDVLPKKYETLVGERGVKLSGGERQRVAIARAFLKDAKILLLDEATSSLDSESEAMIQGALEELMKGKTVIAIAHRLSTLSAMNRIVVIDHGEIVEDGTHDELLVRGGIYSELWSHQAGGFLLDE